MSRKNDEKKNLVPKLLKEEYPFAKTGPGLIETLTKHIVAWVIFCLLNSKKYM